MKLYYAFFCIGIIFLTCGASFGDGFAYKGYDYSTLRPVLEGEQRAVILHRDGIEKMLIAVSLELDEKDKALWIFPVCGKPDEVKVDVVDSFPRFRGRDPRVEVRNRIYDIFGIALATQIYPAFCMSFFLPAGRVHFGSGVDVHAEVEKWGIHAEVVTADSIENFSNYLKDKGINLHGEELKAFNDYLSGKYVFVITWISSREQLLNDFPEYQEMQVSQVHRWPSLYVEFPTERAFYPLRPTSNYGEAAVRINVRFFGYVVLDTSARFANKFSVDYYKQKGLTENLPSKLAEDMNEKETRYTTISYYGNADYLVEDLWFVPTMPIKMKLAEITLRFIGNWYISAICTICCILIASYFCAGISGLLIFRKWKGFAQLGMWNVFTIIGFYIATRFVRGSFAEMFSDPLRTETRFYFISLFSILYVVITIVFMYLLGSLF